MDEAYSMVKARRISASSSGLHSTSNYWELALQCPSCGEPVYWKYGGGTRRDHFCHFHKTPDSEPCPERTDGSSSAAVDYVIDTEKYLLLKDIQQQLFTMLAIDSFDSLLSFKEIPPDFLERFDENISLNETEQRVYNLFRYGRYNTMVDIFKKAFREAEDDYNIFSMVQVMGRHRNIDFKRLGGQKEKIARDILDFLFRSGNKAILTNLIRFFVIEVEKEYPDIDPALKAHIRIIKAVAQRDWIAFFST
ncbi:hypothetical protein [Halomicronema sp. CCY15110]|uniref:hypothetical protein n=1 Tax=Halomicronema sp. CCY15110 TaxID=2767773 RepID=UPI00195037AA|nr:hypothetical protein [Halomicronema sp. CCY15110]